MQILIVNTTKNIAATCHYYGIFGRFKKLEEIVNLRSMLIWINHRFHHLQSVNRFFLCEVMNIWWNGNFWLKSKWLLNAMGLWFMFEIDVIDFQPYNSNVIAFYYINHKISLHSMFLWFVWRAMCGQDKNMYIQNVENGKSITKIHGPMNRSFSQ